MTKILRACRFTFDDTTEFEGYSDGSTWNGFDNIWVTPEERDEIVAEFRTFYPDTADDIAGIPVEDGLVSLANGYATTLSSMLAMTTREFDTRNR